MPYLIMTDFAMVQNHTLQHFAIYPSSSTEEFWVFFFSCLPSTATYMPFYLRNDCYFLWYEGGEKREGNTKKRERERFKSEKSRKQCQFVYKQN